MEALLLAALGLVVLIGLMGEPGSCRCEECEGYARAALRGEEGSP